MKKCDACGFSFRRGDHSRINSHHIRPKEHGGSDDGSNLIDLCPNCHTIAHILIAIAMRDESREVYRLYDRNWLILKIHAYYGVSTWKDRLYVMLYKTRVLIRYKWSFDW